MARQNQRGAVISQYPRPPPPALPSSGSSALTDIIGHNLFFPARCEAVHEDVLVLPSLNLVPASCYTHPPLAHLHAQHSNLCNVVNGYTTKAVALCSDRSPSFAAC